eukprot:6213510-Pleurochrysis_carterae.AAC.1
MRTDPTQPGYAWKATPTFQPLRDGRKNKVISNVHSLSDILPVPVKLTGSAKHDRMKPLLDAKQKFRLSQETVVTLKQYCAEKRPDLYSPIVKKSCADRPDVKAAAPAATKSSAFQTRTTASTSKKGKKSKKRADDSSLDESEFDSSDEDEDEEEDRFSVADDAECEAEAAEAPDKEEQDESEQEAELQGEQEKVEAGEGEQKKEERKQEEQGEVAFGKGGGHFEGEHNEEEDHGNLAGKKRNASCVANSAAEEARLSAIPPTSRTRVLRSRGMGK